MSKKGKNAQKHTYYMSKKSKNDLIIMRNSSSKSDNSTFSKETKKSNLPLLKVQKVEKILDNKAEKYRNISKKNS